MDSAHDDLRVVLVHDWLTGMRGGEKCLEALCRRFPRATLYNLLYRPGAVSPEIERLRLRSSFLQYFPGVHHYYRYLLPLMPLAARWRLPDCDLVISLSHCVAKSACPPPGVPHVCYCFTPMRYIWHLRDAYFGGGRNLGQRMLDGFLHWLREWDRRTAERVTHFVAISKTIQKRIAECYGRTSRVIYPPVDTDFYHPAPLPREDFYLVLSALVPYKRLDLAVEACRRLDRPLVVIGTGPEENRLRALAGPDTRFLGWQPDTVVRDHLRRCKALLFPGEEDFGIVPVEAQACGAPVIALARGGATETVVPINFIGPAIHAEREPTGFLFEDQTVDCLMDALEIFERCQGDFAAQAAREQALRFNAARFRREMFGFLANVVTAETLAA
jgi:glycosyltransferase involved in cell wall biosynthesis